VTDRRGGPARPPDGERDQVLLADPGASRTTGTFPEPARSQPQVCLIAARPAALMSRVAKYP
jgi:hypothetical protein